MYQKDIQSFWNERVKIHNDNVLAPLSFLMIIIIQ